MPKAYIQNRAKDIIFLRKKYNTLIKSALIIYLIMIPFLIKIFVYHNSLNHNDFFLITNFGKLIQIIPEK